MQARRDATTHIRISLKYSMEACVLREVLGEC
jgi:hypothetical protein